MSPTGALIRPTPSATAPSAPLAMRRRRGRAGRLTKVERRIVNPWTWQERAGFVQANDVIGSTSVLYCSGVVSVDGDGKLLHPGDMQAQALQALDNLETLLHRGGYRLADVVRLITYTTDVDAFVAARPALQQRIDAAGCRHASTLLGVARLARPELLVELEATATK